METISGLTELRAKAEGLSGPVCWASDSLRLVSLFGWKGLCSVFTELQPILHYVSGCLSRLTEGPQHYVAESTWKRSRVNRDKTVMTQLPALKSSVQLPSALGRWHFSCLSSIPVLVSSVLVMPQPSPSHVKGCRWREEAGVASTGRGNWILAFRGRLLFCS